MRNEYGVECQVDKLPHVAARWVEHPAGARRCVPARTCWTATDRDERRVLLFQSDWELQYTERENPSVQFLSMA